MSPVGLPTALQFLRSVQDLLLIQIHVDIDEISEKKKIKMVYRQTASFMVTKKKKEKKKQICLMHPKFGRCFNYGIPPSDL